MLVSVFLLCPFSVKVSIKKSTSLWRCFSVHIVYARERKPLNTPIAICGAMFEFGFICTFVINFIRVITSVSDSYIKEINLLVFIFKFEGNARYATTHNSFNCSKTLKNVRKTF